VVVQVDENLTRALQSGLYVVERNLNSVRGALQHTNEDSVLYSTMDDVGSESKSSVLQTIASMLDEIRVVKGLFALRTQEETVRRRAFSYLQVNWEVLHECKSKRLEEYGNLETQERELLDHHIDKLLAMNDELQRVILSVTPNQQ
jgi:hypothetical protein